MKKIIVCLIFLISFVNAIQCYNGKTYVDIPETKLSDIGYTKYNITHSNFDCKMAYKRYLKVKEIEPVNVSYITKSENEKLEEPSKTGFFYLCLIVVIVGVIWLIKNVIKDETQDEWYSVTQKEPIKPTNAVKAEPVKSCDNSSNEYNNLIKLEEERQKKKQAYFDDILGKKYSVKTVEPVNTGDDSFDDYWNNILGYSSDDDSENLERIGQERFKKEPIKSWDDLSKEFSENLRKIEQERLKNDYPVKSVQKNNKTYDELLTKQEWYDFRKKVIYDKGGYVCEFCKKKHNLQVHHKLYYKKPDKEKIEPWLYNMDEVLLLCDDCHKSVHKKNKIKVYYLSYADYDKRKVGFYNNFKQTIVM